MYVLRIAGGITDDLAQLETTRGRINKASAKLRLSLRDFLGHRRLLAGVHAFYKNRFVAICVHLGTMGVQAIRGISIFSFALSECQFSNPINELMLG